MRATMRRLLLSFALIVGQSRADGTPWPQIPKSPLPQALSDYCNIENCQLVRVFSEGNANPPKYVSECATSDFSKASLSLKVNETSYFLVKDDVSLAQTLNITLIAKDNASRVDVHLVSCGFDKTPRETKRLSCVQSATQGVVFSFIQSRFTLVGLWGLEVSGCSFRGVRVDSQNLWVTGSLFANNGGVYPKIQNLSVPKLLETYAQYGGAISSLSQAIIDDSRFINNSADSAGGLFVANGDVHVSNSVFESNRGTNGDGGAINALAGSIWMRESKFVGNSAQSGGAACSKRDIFANTSIFLSNSASEYVSSEDLMMGMAQNYGGALFAFGNITAYNCAIENNSAIVDGGAIYTVAMGVLANCTARNNSAVGYGGVVRAGATVFIVDGGPYENNTAGLGGGVASLYQGNATIGAGYASDTVFISNSAAQGGSFFVGPMNAKNVTFDGNSAYSGGAIYGTKSVVLIDVTLTNNTSTDVYAGGGAVYAERWLNATNVNATYNWGFLGGVYHVNGDITDIGGYYANNTCKGKAPTSNFGGVMYGKSDVYLDGTVLLENAVLLASMSLGHAIYAVGNIKASNISVLSNGMGSPLYANSTVGAATICGQNVSVEASVVRDNVDGFNVIESANINITNSVVEDNEGWYGAIGATGTATVTNCTFRGNQGGPGGALYVRGAATVANSVFEDNSANEGGGAIYGLNYTTMVQSIFRRNTAPEGGAVTSSKGMTVTGCTFDSNHATENGGALYSKSGPIRNSSTTFTNNTAGGDGANFYALDGSQADPPVVAPSEGSDNTVTILAVVFSLVTVAVAAAIVGTVYRLRRETASVDYDALVARIRAQHQWTDAGSSEAAALIGRLQGQAGPVARGHFTLLETLGAGQFGTVSRGVVFVQGRAVVCAVKTAMQSDPKARADFLREAEMMKKVNHDNVVRIIGVCDPLAESENDSDGSEDNSKKPNKAHKSLVRRATRPGSTGGGGVDSALYLLMEYMDRGDLKNYLIKNPLLPAPQRLWLAKEIATALEYVASLGIVHRDVAARNVLLGTLAGGRLCAKLSDLGLARVVGGEQQQYVKTAGGDLLPVRWMAPEAIFDSTYTEASDVWAYAVTVWEIESKGELPYAFLGTTLQVMQGIQHGVRLQKPPNCPDGLYSLLMKCWDKDPQQRPRFWQIRVFLEEYEAKNDLLCEELVENDGQGGSQHTSVAGLSPCTSTDPLNVKPSKSDQHLPTILSVADIGGEDYATLQKPEIQTFNSRVGTNMQAGVVNESGGNKSINSNSMAFDPDDYAVLGGPVGAHSGIGGSKLSAVVVEEEPTDYEPLESFKRPPSSDQG